ncbi:hypothetical protein A3715_12210 [Oleiphilus sp. HI0009]|uniref:LPS-assembly protein LptD n=1 Tax=Oleiphilus sp. HI0125 TaxID=1822266 RepID=UPI0007C36B58|nr:LPS-assembly protein LptD [Oleiphilus sp. HI0125]KZX76795.1 hypothetical protein A3715_12210 [Oleiphilus sp. HI0009]KZZ58503.1 hypothetical protein A3762_07830 [Oleiphilus sp. HI0125]
MPFSLKRPSFFVSMCVTSMMLARVETTLADSANSACATPKIPVLYPQAMGESLGDLSFDPTVTVHADYVEYKENNRLELEGQVEIIREGYYARSDAAVIDQKQNQATMQGHIVIQGPQMHMTSDSADVDLNEGSAKLHNAKFIDPDTGFRGGAELIDQKHETLLSIEDGSFTTCNGEEPDWSFYASEIELDQEQGFGTASHARFTIKDVPVFYVPWFTFPIDKRRKSGFLYPTIGTSNVGSGLYISAPYYLNLAPNYDATITPNWIGGRGAYEEAEFRYKSALQETTLTTGYIDEDKAYIKDQVALGNFDESGERWGWSIEQDWSLDTVYTDTSAYLSYTQISDDDYLDDLDQGLQVTSDDLLDRRLLLSHTGENYRFDALLQQYKSLNINTLASEQPYQRLPELNLDIYEAYQHLDVDWNSQYVYFYREKDDLVGTERVRGSRARHQPRLSVPLRNSWAYATPALSIDHTDYYLEDSGLEDKYQSRTVPTLELDAGMAFDRTPTILPETYTNSLEPRIYYVYSDYVDQSDLPNFDSTIPSFNYDNLFRANRFTGGDRVSDENRLTLSLTSRYTDWERGLDVLSVSLGQVTQFEEQKVGAAQNLRVLDGDSLLASEVTLRPDYLWTFRYSNLWDSSKNETQESVTSASYYSEHSNTILNLAHRFRRGEIEQSDTSVIYPLNAEVSALGQWRYDLGSHRTIGSLAGLEYTSCCWRIQVLGQRYLTDTSEMDNAILFRFQLGGLGGLGVNDAKMDGLIPGYQRREDEIN